MHKDDQRSAEVEAWRVTPEKVTAAVERIAAALGPRRIIAFGSRARHEARWDSDLDLLVLLPSGANAAGQSARLYEELADLVLGTDILVADESRFEQLRLQRNSVYQAADQEGINLYRDGSPDREAIAQVCR